jgi:putative oxidoreductase
MIDLALLILRATVGTLVAGHGAQKLFGWFEGPGLKGTAGFMEQLQLKPGRTWAIAASAAEFGGGSLTAAGLLNPVGPLGVISAMGMATAKVHWGKPIWVTSGGAELPITNIGVASALLAAGPGIYSLDHILKTSLPHWTVLPGLALALGGIALGIRASAQAEAQRPQTQPQAVEIPHEDSGAELQAGETAAHPV